MSNRTKKSSHAQFEMLKYFKYKVFKRTKTVFSPKVACYCIMYIRMIRIRLGESRGQLTNVESQITEMRNYYKRRDLTTFTRSNSSDTTQNLVLQLLIIKYLLILFVYVDTRGKPK